MPTPTVDLKPWFQVVHDLPKRIVWSDFFGNDNPVELDIGCGRGLFTYAASVQNPDVNYLGIELDYGKGRRGAARLKKCESPNGRIVGGDCLIMLNEMIDAGSVAAAHVYFPDPWWKRRHMRRRLFTQSFLDSMYRVVEPNGLVHSWTDVEEYFGVITGLMDGDARYAKMPEPEERDPEHDMDYRTSFERKKRQKGLPIYRGLWRRDGEIFVPSESVDTVADAAGDKAAPEPVPIRFLAQPRKAK